MRFQVVGNKADVTFVAVKNESANVLPVGTPVYLMLTGTDDGLAVTDANSAGVALGGVCMGLVTSNLNPNTQGEAQVFGICQRATMVTGTRAASTNAFNSNAAVNLGDILQAVTVSGAGGLTFNAAGTTGTLFPAFVAAQTLAAVASSVGTTGSNLVRTSVLKVFVRCI